MITLYPAFVKCGEMCVKRSVCVAFSGVLCALGIVLLFSSSLVSLFAYLTPIFAGMLLLISNAHFSARVSLCIYVSTSLLSMALASDRECALLYTLFFGCYPLVYDRLEQIRFVVLRWGIKLLWFNAAFTLCEWLLVVLFGVAPDDVAGVWGIVLIYALFNLLFLLYDRLYKRVSFLYERRFKKRVSRYLK